MSLIPRNVRRDILSTWSRVPELDAEGIRWYPTSRHRADLAESLGWSPTVDFSENDDSYVLTAELPGVDVENVYVEVEDGVLVLKGEKKEEHREHTKEFRLYEREYGAFERRFSLPRSADPDGASARFDNGILTVDLPKRKDAKGRKIRIGTHD